MSDDVALCTRRIISSAQDAVLRACYSLSDSVIFSSSVPKEVSDLRNVYDMDVASLSLATPQAAISALLGFLTTGSLSATVLTSGGISSSVPILSRLASNLTGGVVHSATSSLSSSAHCIDTDASDAMGARGTGMAMIFSSNAQEAYDLSIIAHLASLKTKIPFLHIYPSENGSYEIRDVCYITDNKLKDLIDESAFRTFRANGLSSENSAVFGTVQDSSTYFQSREALNRYYSALSEILQRELDKFAKATGRQYNAFDYIGSKEASKLIIIMGQGSDTVSDTVEYLNKKGEKTAVIKVRLYRPFNAKALMNIIPKTVRFITVLDNTKEAGSSGEALYKDVCTAIEESGRRFNAVLGGRYGIGGKSFTNAAVASIFDNMTGKCLNHFTIGITDDVEKLSLPIDKNFNLSNKNTTETLFFGTAAQLSISPKQLTAAIEQLRKENQADCEVSAYSKAFLSQFGSPTLLTIRSGEDVNNKQYLSTNPDFVVCAQCRYAKIYDVLQGTRENAVFLLNTQYASDDVWNHLPIEVQKHIIEKKMKFYVIDAASIAESENAKIDDIMLIAYFKVCKDFSETETVAKLEEQFEELKGFSKLSSSVFSAIREIMYPTKTGKTKIELSLTKNSSPFIRDVLSEIESFRGDCITVGKLNENGSLPHGVSQYEKRTVISSVPIWDSEKCSQCGKCSLVCPRSCIRMNLLPTVKSKHIPKDFPQTSVKPIAISGKNVTLQISIEDCIACRECEAICSEKALSFEKLTPELKETLKENYEYFQKLALPETLNTSLIRDLAFKKPLFAFSSSAKPSAQSVYIKLISQIFGSRAVLTGAPIEIAQLCAGSPGIALYKDENAHGCAWSTATMSDNAQFALALSASYEEMQKNAKNLAERVLVEGISVNSIRTVLDSTQNNEEEIEKMRKNIAIMTKYLSKSKNADALYLSSIADNLLSRNIWLICTSNWAENEGFMGLNEIFSSNRNINVLVFCENEMKKNLASIALTYNTVYCANISLGANSQHTIDTLIEAESYKGTSILFADSRFGVEAQKEAVKNGEWFLFRNNPDKKNENKNPFVLDSDEPVTQNEKAKSKYKMLSYLSEKTW